MARDVALDMNGEAGASFDFSRSVEGKSAEEQRYLVELSTAKTDLDLYSNKGTDLPGSAASSAMIDRNQASHLGNFAALDAYTFMQEVTFDTSRKEAPYAVTRLDVKPVSYTAATRVLNFVVTMLFADETSTSADVNITT